jgi:hypothetical protein
MGPGGGTVFWVEGSSYWEVSMNLGSSHTWRAADTAADNFKGGGYSDWRLPSKEKLNFIYLNLQKAGIVNFGRDWYWSSTSANAAYWAQSFRDGVQAPDLNGKTHSVLAVRTFKP